MWNAAPQIVTPPSSAPINGSEAKLHLRVTDGEEDTLIDGLVASAVAYLDGWGGVLGRGIMPQTWAEEFAGWGDLELSLPDVGEIVVSGFDADGNAVAADDVEPWISRRGWVVRCSGPTVAKVRVTYDVALPAARLPAAQALIKLLIGHWYENREAAGQGDDLPASAASLIKSLRWVKL
jgi:uncharacterized phiE125 gp8 family phage protein